MCEIVGNFIEAPRASSDVDEAMDITNSGGDCCSNPQRSRLVRERERVIELEAWAPMLRTPRNGRSILYIYLHLSTTR